MKCCDNKFFANLAKHKVTIKQLEATSTEYGGQAITWSDLLVCWARVEPKSTNELDETGRRKTFIGFDVLVRWDSSIANMLELTKYKIAVDGKDLSIQGSRELASDLKSLGKEFILINATFNEQELKA